MKQQNIEIILPCLSQGKINPLRTSARALGAVWKGMVGASHVLLMGFPLKGHNQGTKLAAWGSWGHCPPPAYCTLQLSLPTFTSAPFLGTGSLQHSSTQRFGPWGSTMHKPPLSESNASRSAVPSRQETLVLAASSTFPAEQSRPGGLWTERQPHGTASLELR